MSSHGTSGSAIFYFNPQGELDSFVAQRFRDAKDFEPTRWEARVKAHSDFDGLWIPSELEAIWHLPEGPFTWFKFKITDYE